MITAYLRLYLKNQRKKERMQQRVIFDGEINKNNYRKCCKIMFENIEILFANGVLNKFFSLTIYISERFINYLGMVRFVYHVRIFI